MSCPASIKWNEVYGKEDILFCHHPSAWILIFEGLLYFMHLIFIYEETWKVIIKIPLKQTRIQLVTGLN